MAKDILDFIVSVLEQLHGWIGGSLLALGVELLDRIWDWKIPRKPWIAIFIVGGLIVSTFGAWKEERNKVRTQNAYMRIVLGGAPWIQPTPIWLPDRPLLMNFGKENATPYPAIEESSIQELLIRPAPFPLVGPFSPNSNEPSSPELETSVWDEMLIDRGSGRHPTATFDPAEKAFVTATTKVKVNDAQLERMEVFKTDMVYFVGLDKWNDGTGTRGKSFCYWLHPRTSLDIVYEKCETHNDFIEDATQYLKFFK